MRGTPCEEGGTVIQNFFSGVASAFIVFVSSFVGFCSIQFLLAFFLVVYVTRGPRKRTSFPTCNEARSGKGQVENCPSSHYSWLIEGA